MARPFRVFEFEIGVPMDQRLRIIRAALDDEDLALGPKSGSADMVTSVIQAGRCETRVPLTRVMSREDAQAWYASLPPRHQFAPETDGSYVCHAPCGQRKGHPVHRLKEDLT